jgi:hypothetical protein
MIRHDFVKLTGLRPKNLGEKTVETPFVDLVLEDAHTVMTFIEQLVHSIKSQPYLLKLLMEHATVAAGGARTEPDRTTEEYMELYVDYISPKTELLKALVEYAGTYLGDEETEEEK